MEHRVEFTRKAKKEHDKLEQRLRNKVSLWVTRVQTLGIDAVRAQYPGYKDHRLHGKKEGRQSIYLNTQWRLEYSRRKVEEEGQETEIIVIDLITVEEIHPHDY